VILRGKSQVGKNRIRELGSEWVIVRESDNLLFNLSSGPAWLLQPVGQNSEKSRWVFKNNDPHFEVVQ
jgi:hypothetical protein